ncbi:MAG: tetratricopeptide repeat protein [Pyrinomonadaceae bacterium]
MNKIMRPKILIGTIISMLFWAALAFGQATRAITVVTEPQAVIWLDDVRRGAADETGSLTIKNLSPGIHRIRVRADGFKETAQTLTAAQKGEVKIPLTKTNDQAELAFQEAERLSTVDRQKAIDAYRKAIALRPKYAEAQVALARILSDSGDAEGALKAIADARKSRPIYPEASAVEGRIYKADDKEDKAVLSFKRAIREGRGFQPEAHAGLGLLYKDRAENAGSANDFENQKLNYELATGELLTAARQLSGAPDAIVIYQLLGETYEKMRDYKKAIAVYEEFLRVFPDANEATAVKSFIVQLKKQMNGEQ